MGRHFDEKKKKKEEVQLTLFYERLKGEKSF